ncbi:hypothetical protein [Burkholderia latens]|nr:hypothetical protein [Burkholderia latens]
MNVDAQSADSGHAETPKRRNAETPKRRLADSPFVAGEVCEQTTG